MSSPQPIREIQGTSVPAIGYGTWELTGDDCLNGVRTALEVGYRHLDTAQVYGNEHLVGAALTSSGVDRSEVFLTTKIWNDNFTPDGIKSSFGESLDKLQTDYVDLLLLHWPLEMDRLEENLGALTDLVAQGGVRHIGVSNFTPRQLERAMEIAPLFCIQVEHHPFSAESVFGGRVTHSSREALAATLARDPIAAREVAALVSHAEPLPPAGIRPLITAHAASRCATPPDVVAGLVLSLAGPELRDEAWRWLSRDAAPTYVEFWSDLVRRTPEELVPGPASVLALTAWLAGEGALAWCAVDRARAVDPEHSLAGVVAEMLMSATSPDHTPRRAPARRST